MFFSGHFCLNDFFAIFGSIIFVKLFFVYNLFIFLRKSGVGKVLKPPTLSFCAVLRDRATEIIVDHQKT